MLLQIDKLFCFQILYYKTAIIDFFQSCLDLRN